jgi:hypothetical protein
LRDCLPNATRQIQILLGATSLGKIRTEHRSFRVKYWEIIADNLSKAGWRSKRITPR